MVHPADEAFNEALKSLGPSERTIASPRIVYGRNCALVEVPYADVVEMAMKTMRKSPVARADAVEMAYDNRLWEKGLKQWERTGEVILMKKLGVARALCRMKER